MPESGRKGVSMDIYEKIKERNIKLPEAPAKGGLYTPCVLFGEKERLAYISGCGAVIDGQKADGKLGRDYTLEEGKEFARRSMLNVLATLEATVGDLNRVSRAVKILVFVASADDFTMQPQVANGASELLAELFGRDCVPARSAIGVNVLPGNLPVEIEAIFELKEE